MTRGEGTFLLLFVASFSFFIFVGHTAVVTENTELCKSRDMTYNDGDCISSDGTVYNIRLEKKKVLVPAPKQ